MTTSVTTQVRSNFSTKVRPTEKVFELWRITSSVTATIMAAQFAAACSPQKTKAFDELVFELKHVIFDLSIAIDDLKRLAVTVKEVLRDADSTPSRPLLVTTAGLKEEEVRDLMRDVAKIGLAPFTGIGRSIGTYLKRIESFSENPDAPMIARMLEESWKPISRKVWILTALYTLGLSAQKTGD